MPDAPTHFVFAEDFLTARAGKRGPESFNLPELFAGTQGPDPFYFYGRLGRGSAEVRSRVRGFADALHSLGPGELFFRLASAAAAYGDATQRSRGATFVMGLLLHYVLDRKLHPYVYYRSGFNEDGKLGPQESASHGRFEAILAAALHRLLRPGTKPPRPSALLGTVRRRGRKAADAGDFLFAAAFPGKILPGEYAASWTDMVRVLGLLHDPWGIKARLVETLGGGASQARAMMIPPRVPPDDVSPWPDILNLEGTEWRYPDSGEASRASVPVLYDQALADAVSAADLLSAVLDSPRSGPEPPEGWVEFFAGINHEGCRADRMMRFKAEKNPTGRAIV